MSDLGNVAYLSFSLGALMEHTLALIATGLSRRIAAIPNLADFAVETEHNEAMLNHCMPTTK